MKLRTDDTIKTSLVSEQDNENLSMFRRRNKLLFLFFSLLITSLTLTLCVLITYLVRNTWHYSHKPLVNPAVEAFCSVADNAPPCLNAFGRIISVESSTHPNQIFALSLRTAAKRLETVISTIASESNCSSSLQAGLGRIREASTLVEPFVETRNDEYRDEMMGKITGAEEDLNECIASTAVGEVAARVQEVKVYVSCSGDYLLGHVEALQMFWRESYAGEIMRDEVVFCMCVGGLQLLFMVFMFWALFRFR